MEVSGSAFTPSTLLGRQEGERATSGLATLAGGPELRVEKLARDLSFEASHLWSIVEVGSRSTQRYLLQPHRAKYRSVFGAALSSILCEIGILKWLLGAGSGKSNFGELSKGEYR
ncbi:hypothetical protein TNCV_4593331 [Trichonephila clavipes]|uniref:Uncharacterized protein n=1 Tax=Trichonephila clavipes TaxID=2585209 RepID=A0A8X6WG98_TRICX|nr:hypothetical protein TNCV_4593331 [Trichonephila clavipes]